MKPINIMLNGMPGNVASIIAGHIAADDRFNLIPFSMTGAEIEAITHNIKGLDFKLLKPDEIENSVLKIIKEFPDMIAVDFTHPTAVNKNGEFYVKFNIPFVMGTTGGDRQALSKTVLSSSISAVIAPNMAKQIVGFQAMMEYAAETFPDLFKGYTLQIKESHQKGKADTSGTAKAMVRYYNKLGIPFAEDDIIMERDPEIQKREWHIPEEHLTGHAWHTYTLTSPNSTAKFEFSHNINGRDIYAQGTIDAALFLHKKINEEINLQVKGKKGTVYTMIDVLRGL
ncbi:MAG: dihydrodipicolinate reductase [Desulfamplus sp.]|nr:dihydrodipicolinate reductase [Desulfamplus sp.]MBF0412408.1 dihydrodipicolinate reductase [Desulfamplus sp.]